MKRSVSRIFFRDRFFQIKQTDIFENGDHHIHQQYLMNLPKIPQNIEDIKIILSPEDFYQALILAIANAQKRIFLVLLYLEHDEGGEKILKAIYQAKTIHPHLEVAVLVDFHRAIRNRIHDMKVTTNADWYYEIAQTHPNIDVPVYGVPVNTHEALGIFHLKGFIIDDQVIYSGASINNIYLHQNTKYRYDRYQIIRNLSLSDTLLNYIHQALITDPAVTRIDNTQFIFQFTHRKETIRLFRKSLKKSFYRYLGEASPNEFSITPIVGLGKQNTLNEVIHHLICSAHHRVIFCTPYFNLPTLLVRDITHILRIGCTIEIIVGDKTANDFYISESHYFNIMDILPYFYETILRRFIRRFQTYLDNGQLIIRLWKDGVNSFHLKGIWVDEEWQLLTGNNLNTRSWILDLENGLLLHDPKQTLHKQRDTELTVLRTHTHVLHHYTELQKIADYPIKVRQLIRRLYRLRIYSLISWIL